MHGCAGQYNEQVFKAIDFILNEMSKQGIKVIVALVDYWKMTDGVQQVCCCTFAGCIAVCPLDGCCRPAVKPHHFSGLEASCHDTTCHE